MSSTFWAFNLAMLTDGVVMTLAWSVILFHIWTGNKNKWLMMMTVMLLISSIGSLLLSYYIYQVWGRANISRTILFVMCLCQSVQNLFFNISHLLMAYKYRAISRNVPNQIEGKPLIVDTTCEKVIYWFLFALCFIGPIIQCPAVYQFRLQQFII